jgi:anti-sigma-K factor RskA
MNHDEVAELAAAYALGALDGEERTRFEALLAAGDADARAALRDFESTVATLAAETAESPPPAVKSALMARIDSEERSRGNVTRVLSMPRTAPPRRSLWTVVAVGAIAAGVAAIAVGLAVSTVYERRVGQLAQEQAQLREELARQESLVTIFQDPATQVAALSGLAPAPEAKARLLWHATAGGLLVAQGLPPAPAGKAYELWAITGTGAPVPAGVFAVDARGVGSLRVAPLRSGAPPDTFAVTLEPADGVTAPTGSMYLVGKL